jgi:hypothetical protein
VLEGNRKADSKIEGQVDGIVQGAVWSAQGALAVVTETVAQAFDGASVDIRSSATVLGQREGWDLEGTRKMDSTVLMNSSVYSNGGQASDGTISLLEDRCRRWATWKAGYSGQIR